MSAYALVIDDNRETADTLVKILGLLGYQAQAAYGPRSGLESLARRVPDVILLDVHMQGVEGEEVCQYVRRDPRTATTPILAISSDIQPEVVDRMRKAGANGFLAKPVETDELERVLRDVRRLTG